MTTSNTAERGPHPGRKAAAKGRPKEKNGQTAKQPASLTLKKHGLPPSAHACAQTGRHVKNPRRRQAHRPLRATVPPCKRARTGGGRQRSARLMRRHRTVPPPPRRFRRHTETDPIPRRAARRTIGRFRPDARSGSAVFLHCILFCVSGRTAFEGRHRYSPAPSGKYRPKAAHPIYPAECRKHGSRGYRPCV